MNTITSRPSPWLRILLLAYFFFTQLPQVSLAQDSRSSTGVSATANARSPDPSSSTSSQASSTSSAPAQTHTVQVGLADHKFKPDVTEAEIGDTIEFDFYPANHSVVRAEYGFPCIPYEMTGNNKAGFFSGFKAVDKVLDNPPKYSIKINDTKPIFFYCSAPSSCITYGMVGAINPNATISISTQQQKARDSAYMLSPGEPFPAESPLPSNLPSSTSIPAAVSQKHGLSAGAIAGIVIAAVGVIILAALLFFFWGRSKTLKDEVDRKESSIARRMSASHAPNMLQPSASHTPAAHYQQYTSPPSPHPQPQSQHHQAQANFPPLDSKFQDPPPGHPAYSVPPSNPHPHPAFPTNSIYAEPQHHATSTSTPFELSPHGSTYLPAHTQSPHPAGELNYGPMGRQSNSPAPPYGWHVNASPAEVEGTPVKGGVGKERERVQDRERARWEEVGAKSGEARMF